MNTTLKIQKSNLYEVTLFFIYIPVIVFLFGFTKPLIAIGVTSVLFWIWIKDRKGRRMMMREEQVEISFWLFLAGIFLLVYIALVSGLGGGGIHKQMTGLSITQLCMI